MGLGSKWIFPRTMAGTDGDELDELTAANALPAFTDAEMAELRAFLVARKFTPRARRKSAGELFVHQLFDVKAELTRTRLMFDSSKDFDGVLTGAEIAGDIATRPAFALYDVWNGKWTPEKPPKGKRKKKVTR